MFIIGLALLLQLPSASDPVYYIVPAPFVDPRLTFEPCALFRVFLHVAVCGGGEKRIYASETAGVYGTYTLLRNCAAQQLSSASPAGCCIAIVQ